MLASTHDCSNLSELKVEQTLTPQSHHPCGFGCKDWERTMDNIPTPQKVLSDSSALSQEYPRYTGFTRIRTWISPKDSSTSETWMSTSGDCTS